MNIPYVIEKNGSSERSYDIYSRLLKDRIIMLSGEINDAVANCIIAQFLFLASQSEEDINFYINSPGGHITAGMAIFDTINYIKPDVSTICVGLAASMGAFLLSSGTVGKRYALENSEILIHQPLGGVKGQATDIKIVAEHILKVRSRLNSILSKNTNQPLDKIEKDTDRDNYMFAEEALAYGIIDKVVKNSDK